MRFGILQRYVIRQVVTSFVLALLTITAIFVLFVVMAEASRNGLTPLDIARIVPFMVPVSLPYSVPVALLFSATVVYGRMAGDNEIIAIKSAGLDHWTVLNPSLMLAAALSGALFYFSTDPIPRASFGVKRVFLSNAEDLFYKFLKKDRQIDNPGWPFFIRVSDVDEDKTMIGAVFMHRAPGPTGKLDSFDLTVRARKARIRFDNDSSPPQAVIELEDARTEGGQQNPFLVMIGGKQSLVYPLPTKGTGMDKRPQEMTNAELDRAIAQNEKMIRDERKRQAIAASLKIAAGHLVAIPPPLPGFKPVEGVDWPGMQNAFTQYKYWKVKVSSFQTEKQMRAALSVGAFCFVFLGAPVGILFARRDFLSAFISCFVPIIVLYYPLILAGVNLGKEGVAPPWTAWGGDVVLWLLAWLFAIPPVRRH